MNVNGNKAPLWTLIIILAGGSILLARGGERRAAAKPQDVTLTGRIVDLQSHVAGAHQAKDKEHDEMIKETRDRLRAGIAAAIETQDHGTAILGWDPEVNKKIRGQILGLAFQEVQIEGKLYETDDLQYIEAVSITPLPVGKITKQKDHQRPGEVEEENEEKENDTPDEETEE